MAEYEAVIGIGEANINKAIRLPPNGRMDLPDGRRLTLVEWEPIARVGEIVKVRALVNVEKLTETD